MPREFLFVTPDPITLYECAAAATAIDPDLGLGRLWQGGGLQIAGDGLVLAVLRSSAIEVADDVERMLGSSVVADPSYLTEAYGPFDSPLTFALVEQLALAANGTVAEQNQADLKQAELKLSQLKQSQLSQSHLAVTSWVSPERGDSA